LSISVACEGESGSMFIDATKVEYCSREGLLGTEAQRGREHSVCNQFEDKPETHPKKT